MLVSYFSANIMPFEQYSVEPEKALLFPQAPQIPGAQLGADEIRIPCLCPAVGPRRQGARVASRPGAAL
jgi:hypothetical protein